MAIGLAGTFHDALETFRVLWVEDDHDVPSANGLCDQPTQHDALARLRCADHQRTSLQVLQRAVKRHLDRFHPMDIGHADFAARLTIHFITEESDQPRCNEILAIIDLAQLIKSLRVLRLPLESMADQHLSWLPDQCVKFSESDASHCATGQCRAPIDDRQALAKAPRAKHCGDGADCGA